MPIPRPSEETREDWMSRCIPVLIGEGKDKAQAIAICSSMWSDAKIYKGVFFKMDDKTEHEDFNVYVNGKLEVMTNDESEVQPYIETIPETSTFAVRDREGVVIEKYMRR
jgi:hypothetical protein